MERLTEQHKTEKIDSVTYNTIEKTVKKDIKNTIEYNGLIVRKYNARDIDIGLEALASKYTDLSGYEWSCNETYIMKSKVSGAHMAIAALALFDYLEKHLAAKFHNRRFCICISLDLGEYPGITAHFCQFRAGEMCFDLNIDNYTQPVMYAFIDT